jgi:predicted PurR-regulated permease PerM
MIFLTIIFILLEIPCLPAKLKKASPSSQKISVRLDRFTKTLKHYLGIKTAISLLTGVLITIILSLIGVDFPIIWGFLAFMMNFIPNIGSIIAAVPAVLLAFLQGGLSLGLMTTACYVTINVVIGNVVEPKVMGRGLGLSTLVVFISLIFWGWLLGPVGMLLCVPLTMFIKIAVEEDEEIGWLAVLLGSGEELREDAAEETA